MDVVPIPNEPAPGARIPNPSRVFRILIADDHEMVRQGVRALFEKERQFAVCGEAANGREAIDQVRKLSPDVVILDISMPVMGGLEAAAEIRRLAPQTKILILTMHDSMQMRERARAAGADSFVVKAESGRKLMQMVKFLLEIGEAETQ